MEDQQFSHQSPLSKTRPRPVWKSHQTKIAQYLIILVCRGLAAAALLRLTPHNMKSNSFSSFHAITLHYNFSGTKVLFISNIQNILDKTFGSGPVVNEVFYFKVLVLGPASIQPTGDKILPMSEDRSTAALLHFLLATTDNCQTSDSFAGWCWCGNTSGVWRNNLKGIMVVSSYYHHSS